VTTEAQVLTAGPISPWAGQPVVLGEDTLTGSAVADVARRPADVSIRLDDEAERRMHRAVDLMHTLIATGQPMYGITTGFGDSCIR
jgi:histidine ammonia-lyase